MFVTQTIRIGEGLLVPCELRGTVFTLVSRFASVVTNSGCGVWPVLEEERKSRCSDSVYGLVLSRCGLHV